MTKTQNKNWAIIDEQFNVFEGNFHILRDCTQMLFSNQQLNFNFDTAASLLSMLYADVKSYRTVLYTYRMNVRNAIPTLLQQYLPISLVPKESPLAILKSVAADQSLSGSRLSLAIPPTDLLSYYDAKLLRDVVTLDDGTSSYNCHSVGLATNCFFYVPGSNSSDATARTLYGDPMGHRSALSCHTRRSNGIGRTYKRSIRSMYRIS